MKHRLLTFVALATLLSLGACSSNEYESLKAGFDNPPQGARTQVWWHWMNGNVTKEGIKKDLEWMDRIGLGGFHHFDAAMSTPQTVEKRLIYMDEGWKDAFAYATAKADSLGLEMTIASSPGWSATGGPWVEPKDAMKKLVWRTSYIDGGAHFNGALPEAFDATGAFQNAAAEGRGSASVAKYYEDVAVIAMKLTDDDKSIAQMGAKVTASGGSFDLAQLCDDDLTNGGFLPATANNSDAWIQFEFPQAQTIRAVTLSDGRGGGGRPGMGGGNADVWLASSDNGRDFTKVADLVGGGAAQRTVSVPATTARYFRVMYRNPRPAAPSMFGMGRPAPQRGPVGTKVAELVLHSASKVNRAEDKAGFTASANLGAAITLPSANEAFAQASDVIDITSKMKDGVLDWDVPAGRWRVYRFGFSLTGKQNHPAPPEATGLEVDKLDPVAWTKFFHTYLDMYTDASSGLIGQHGVQYVLTDSYEAEQENWTPAMKEEFLKRRGYDMTPWMPVLAGAVVGSPEQSDAFLFDWRKTIGELISANYDLLTKIAVEDYGMKGRYSEAHEGGRVYPVDGMDVKKTAAVPMSAMWVCAPWIGGPSQPVRREGYMTDCQESASVAHIYGQNVAAAESLTAWGNVQYSFSPQNLKAVADLELACGINRFVIHESAQQPTDDFVPGYSLGGIGQWFNRHDTWAEQAGVWVDYMSRSSFMLQAGLNVADVLVYYGEDSNITSAFSSRHVQLPAGYNFDYLSPDALLNQIVCNKGVLSSKSSGTQYKVLWLERGCERMSVDVLRKIASLAKSGAVIVGKRPTATTGLMDSREEFDALVAEIWDADRENVHEDCEMAHVMREISVQPDITASAETGVRFLHRTLKGIEVYWINRPANDYLNTEISFRVSGKNAQIWHPDTGVIEDADYRIENGRTIVKLSFVPEDAVFVVFSGKGSGRTLAARGEKVSAEVAGPWNVKFQERRGAPESAQFTELKSYTESDEFGIKYFSGIAEYSNTVAVSPAAGQQTFLDLGSVGNLAEVYVNGQYCGTAWKEPFRVDISKAVKYGDNELTIKVVNLWVNRLIGDEQPDCPQKITRTDARHYRADSPLLPSGLMGPVKVVTK